MDRTDEIGGGADAEMRARATREILEVIGRSRDDEGPVFDVILKNALRLCDVDWAVLCIANPARTDVVLTAVAGTTTTEFRVGVDSWPMHSQQNLVRAVAQKRMIHTPDMRETDLYRSGDETRVAVVDKDGMRTQLALPLMQRGEAIGSFVFYRRKVLPFVDAEIAQLETFAAQAVIAIENVRQFRELQTRLEREEASREILGVISQSRDDEAPVFDAILKSAKRLCGAETVSLVLANAERTHVVRVAYSGGPDRLTIGERFPVDKTELGAVQAFVDGRVLHRPDLLAAPRTEGTRLLIEEGVRTLIWVPLIRRGEPVGCLGLFRHAQRPFSDSEIALAETFAAQAVIAIENVRQFRELQTRLEREAASREILGVISRSRDDETPVFETLLAKAAKLCDAAHAGLCLVNDERTHVVLTAATDQQRFFSVGVDRFPLDAGIGVTRSVRECRIIHRKDISELLAQGGHDELMTETLTRLLEQGIRTILWVPLVRADLAIGSFGLFRHEARPFSDDEIALVETFAAQAVVAIENVRQFRALEARTAELNELNASLEDRVEEQVGEIERMGKLKSFLPAAVADAVVSSGSDKMLQSHRALLGILFCDIRGFTAFCETAEPEETIEVLQTYHQEMGRLIAGHGAGVDHRMGDGIMVLFNDPLPCDDPAGEAVRLAMAMREKMAELCRGWKKMGYRLGFGVGVSLGYATVGMVGYEGRSDYTASGTAVNLAARLCDQAEDGEILLSPRAFIAVEDDVECAPGGVLDLKGLAAPVEVMKAVALRDGSGTSGPRA